ncbi:response regulator transcription factor [Streptomyces yaizuensis]|nr:response regulator transcription factor [Streptomyces sp. YSPA8]
MPDIAEEPPPRRPHPPPPAAGPLRIVVADDNPVVRAGLTALLGAHPGIDVVAAAADGREACAEVLRHRPDGILLDVRMPGADGLSVLPCLVRLAPVLMLTYSRESRTVRTALARGAAGYLVHGEFTADELVQAVRDITAGRPALSPSAARVLSAVPVEQPVGMSASAHTGRWSDLRTVPTGLSALDGHADAVLRECAANPSLSQANMGHSAAGSPPEHPGGTVLTELSRREAEVMELIAAGMTNQEIAAACFISQKTVKNHINRIFAKLNTGSRGEAIALWHRWAGKGVRPA